MSLFYEECNSVTYTTHLAPRWSNEGGSETRFNPNQVPPLSGGTLLKKDPHLKEPPECKTGLFCLQTSRCKKLLCFRSFGRQRGRLEKTETLTLEPLEPKDKSSCQMEDTGCQQATCTREDNTLWCVFFNEKSVSSCTVTMTQAVGTPRPQESRQEMFSRSSSLAHFTRPHDEDVGRLLKQIQRQRSCWVLGPLQISFRIHKETN